DRLVARGWTQQPDRVVGSHGAGRGLSSGLLHQMVGRRPVAVAVEEGADDAAVQDPGEGLVVGLGHPIREHLVPLHEAADVQRLAVRVDAAEAGVLRGVTLLQAEVAHGICRQRVTWREATMLSRRFAHSFICGVSKWRARAASLSQISWSMNCAGFSVDWCR